MADVFVCYSRKDETQMEAVAEQLRYGRTSFWYDQHISGGESWWQAILREIEACQVFMYLISSATLRSEYCRRELQHAIAHHKQILPVLVEPGVDLQQAGDLADEIQRIQWVDLTKDDRRTWARFFGAVNGRLQAAASSEKPPTAGERYDMGDLTAASANIGGTINYHGTVNISTVQPPSVQEEPEPQPTRRGGGLNPWMGVTGVLVIIVGVLLVVLLGDGFGVQTINPTSATAPTEAIAQAPTTELTPTPTPSPTAMATPTPGAATDTPTMIPTLTGGLPDEAYTRPMVNSEWFPVEREFDGVNMMLVPVGCFMMGSINGRENEQPLHEKCFEQPFWIDKYEVTNAQYGTLSPPGECREVSNQPDQPRNCVTLAQAQQHCDSRGARLPTESEWEYAARGPGSFTYPFGDRWESIHVNWAGTTPKRTFFVGNFSGGVSWVGANDLSGNVWEWTSSEAVPYPLPSDSDDENAPPRNILRGGSFRDASMELRAAYRLEDAPGVINESYGFRCVRDVE